MDFYFCFVSVLQKITIILFCNIKKWNYALWCQKAFKMAFQYFSERLILKVFFFHLFLCCRWAQLQYSITQNYKNRNISQTSLVCTKRHICFKYFSTRRANFEGLSNFLRLHYKRLHSNLVLCVLKDLLKLMYVK